MSGLSPYRRSSNARSGDVTLSPVRDSQDTVRTTCEPVAVNKTVQHVRHLIPIHPGDYSRYQRAYCYPLVAYQQNAPVIQPCTTTFEDFPPLDGWRAFVHPEGARYFYRDHNDEPFAVLTDAWIYDSEQHDQIMACVKEIADKRIPECPNFPKPPSLKDTPRTPPAQDTTLQTFQSTPSQGTPPVPSQNAEPSQHVAPVVLVLDARLSGETGYYFVFHPTQSVFWLEPFDFSLALREVHIEHSLEPDKSMGVKTMMKCHYWKHNDFFPDVYELEREDIEKVDGMIRFVIGDTLTSTTGVMKLYTLDELNLLSSIVREYFDDSLESKKMRRKRVGERQMICRVISQFYRERFFNLHGARGARLDSSQSIHYSPQRRMKYIDAQERSPSPAPELPWYRRLPQVLAKPKAATLSDAEKGQGKASVGEERLVEADAAIQPIVIAKHHTSIWMVLFSLAMFGGPNFHLRRLRSLAVDMKVNDAELQKYKKKMVEEWKDVNLYGTVLLAANVSFLAISSIDTAGSGKPSRTPSQRASYLSILASMGTILSSFMLLGRHRGIMKPLFIAQRSTTRQSIESLALIYAAPFSLAIWSILSFFLSFAILWFDSTDYVVIGLIGSFSTLFAFFLIWAGIAPHWGSFGITRSRQQKIQTKKMVIRRETERKPEAVLPNQPLVLSLQACDTHKLVEEYQDQVDCRDSAYDAQNDDGENVELAFVDDEDAYDGISFLSVGTGTPPDMHLGSGLGSVADFISIATNSERTHFQLRRSAASLPRQGDDKKYWRFNMNRGMSERDWAKKVVKKWLGLKEEVQQVKYDEVMVKMDDWTALNCIRELTDKWLDHGSDESEGLQPVKIPEKVEACAARIVMISRK
ncbi:hypothetical protein NMY22_g5363 [Coprinellus aureogranulatus]|nr:hypothetical protein NMY22_g5363 [Coprinellus aureogranulatus]